MNHWKLHSIIGQSPMDGVTDPAFRYITDRYGKPDILFTEFVSVEGLGKGVAKLLTSFIKHNTSTPTVAQIYGTQIKDFYRTAILIAELGFSGIDINMGCPNQNISQRGAGAGLIKTPLIAQMIIKTVKKAIEDWHNGAKIENLEFSDSICAWVTKHRPSNITRNKLPISVKTRIGYDRIITKDWISYLLETIPSAISIHGRTLKQLYGGKVNWEEIARASELSKNTKTKILGNGDICSISDAQDKIQRFKLDGILIGRASLGNPWVFANKHVSTSVRLKTALEHCRVFEQLTPEGHFISLRKHLTWYCKNFRNSSKLRDKLMHTNTISEVEKILSPVIAFFEGDQKVPAFARDYR